MNGGKDAPDATDAGKLAWKVLGFEISRKTEFIALAAFVISLSSAAWQVQNYLRGAKIILFATDQITFISSQKLGRAYDNEPNLLKIIATMSYVNEGDVGQNGTVRDERVRLSLAGKEYEQRGYELVSSDMKNNEPDITRKGESHPFAVTAGGSESHETLFTPWVKVCAASEAACSPRQDYLEWKDLLALMKQNKALTVTTEANIYSKSSVTAKCTVTATDREISILEEKEWLAFACRS